MSIHASPVHTTVYPLEKHPQLAVISTPLTDDLWSGPVITEGRVYNCQQDGIAWGNGWGVPYTLAVAGLFTAGWLYKVERLGRGIWIDGIQWSKPAVPITLAAYVLILVVYVKWRCGSVLYESVCSIPSVGVQFSITRGLSLPSVSRSSHDRLLVPLSTSRVLIPSSDISTVVIHQGLERFRVRYYLAVVKRQGEGTVVAFQGVRPPFEVLREMYHLVRETMFDEYAPDAEEGH